MVPISASNINELIAKIDDRLASLGTKVKVLETVADQLRENQTRIEGNYKEQIQKLEDRFWGVFILCITESIGILLFLMEKFWGS